MHELGLIHQIIKTVDEVKTENQLTEIESITLQVGEMCDVVPAFLEQAWENAKDTAGYSQTKLLIENVKATARCYQCGEINDVRRIDFQCPACGSPDFKIVSGREFLIKEITAK